MSIWLTKSSIISFNHAYFGRTGGVSSGVYESLNVSSVLEDDPKNVAENRRLALDAVHMDPDRAVYLGKLPHGNDSVVVSEKAKGLEFYAYDIIATNTPNLPIALYTADCMPIILSDEKNGAAAIAHAGWRGMVANVALNAVTTMQKEFGSLPAELKVAIGPSISPEVYQVGDDVASQFAERYLIKKGDNTHLDLWTCAEDQLRQAGVEQIDNLRVDTLSDDKYFSFRQDKGDTGRQLTVISL